MLASTLIIDNTKKIIITWDSYPGDFIRIRTVNKVDSTSQSELTGVGFVCDASTV